MSSRKPRKPDGPGVPPQNAKPENPSDIPTEKLDPARQPNETPPQSLVGHTLAQYRITEHLGQGGMGVVYKAKDTRLDRSVALKFLPPQLLSDRGAKQRFLREARAAAALDDPHICTVHEIAEVEGHTFIVMNYVEGGSLKDRIRRNPPDVREALEITAQIAEGLSKAHSQGIVHRDIKPANILLTPEGRVKIADFGLAKLAHHTRLTRTGAVVGTLAYMSPEQTRGQEVDLRADIWSLGVVLYEMLTGELPFRGDNDRAMARSILKKSPKPISDFRPDVPLELENLVEKSLSKRPGKRHQGVEDFLGGLEEQIRVMEMGFKPGSFISLQRFFRKRGTKRVVRATMSLAVLAGILWMAKPFIPPPVAPRIMVASLENASSQEDLDWISGAVMSGLIRTLGDVRGYNVVSRQTVAASIGAVHASSPLDPSAVYGVAEEVGASYLVSGTFKRAGAWLVLDCELTDVREGVLAGSWSIELADSTRIHEAVVELSVNLAGALEASWEQDPRTSPSTKPTASTTALKHYERALSAEERDDYGAAVDELLKAVSYDSTFAEAHFAIARLTSEREVEQKHYTLAMKYRLATPPIVRKLIEAQGMVWDGNVDPAIDLYEEILREDPEQVTARKELARLYSARGRFNEVLSEYAVLHQISPLDFSYYRDWAMTYVRNGRPDEAVDLIKGWRRRFPDRKEPLHVLLVLYHRITRYQEGVALCDSLASIDPGAQPYPCGWLLESVGRLDDAERVFSRLVQSPDAMIPSTRGHAYLAWLSERRQDYLGGLGYIEKVLEKSDGTWYRWLAGKLALGAGRINLAREHADAIVRLNPDITDTTVVEAVGNRRWYFDLLGLIEMAEDNHAEAVKWFEKTLEYTSRLDDASFRWHLGLAYMEAGLLTDAAQELEHALSLSPAFPQALLHLGETYLRMEDYDQSMKTLNTLEDLWSNADADDPLRAELDRLIETASAQR